ncbi:uncharacterized protein LOC130993950 [Salvia miltiorrhiza]|uniref:uncharacterized protein LOC130993950 n=1 Tax=Salvia miltiorrhiza TaxID=226208 RepID=UPI0025AD8508|nr:uncharacterized protein LOC130993950 [Salvia miltiorrhiza]
MNPENGGGQCVEAVDGKQFDDLYKATMENRWSQVLQILKENNTLHHTKLTKSLETALHVAISTYHPKTPSSHLTHMIQLMKSSGTLATVLATENQRGDTPLHLAAAVGCLPIIDSLQEQDLLQPPLHSRNKKGETPLFLAALHGNLAVFRRLHKLKPQDESLARRKDGNTILHKAIFEENFELAYEIICKYSKMVKSINEDGESPLHVLAKKPNVFKSSSHLRFYDSIIYYCVFVEKLNDEKFSNGSPDDSTAAPLETKLKYPDNYTTCVKIFLIIRDSIIVIFKNNRPSDEENQYHQQKRALNSAIAKGKKGYRSYHDLFPVNYDTCIDLFKFAMKVILIILGVGFWRVHKINEKKKRYLNAMDVLDKMLEDESGYKYDNNGQRPQLDPQEVSGKIEIPKAPPQFDVDDNTIAAPTSSSNPPPHSNAQNNQGSQLQFSTILTCCGFNTKEITIALTKQ